jgi:single-strand DNA-binding protein
MNIVILRGTLSSEPALRPLPSGSTLLTCEVTTRPSEGPARSVPVAWFDPPATLGLGVGTEVVVTGEVRRRFFRTGGVTASPTDVVATTVLPARQATRAGRAIAAALAEAEAGR